MEKLRPTRALSEVPQPGVALLGQSPKSVQERRWDWEVTAVKSMGKQKRCPGWLAFYLDCGARVL